MTATWDEQVTPSSRRLNSLASGMPICTTYLEIGVQEGRTFESIRVPFRWAVDPYPTFNTRQLPQGVRVSATTSDCYFADLPDSHAFDLIFLDGLHEWQQTYRDLINALRFSPPHALVVIDDVIPDDEICALPDVDEAMKRKRSAGITDGRWQGDVYKVLWVINRHHPELGLAVIGEETRDAQAIVWRDQTSAHGQWVRFTAEDIASFASMSYEEAFPNGLIPTFFNVVDESVGISRAIAASRHAFQNH